MNLLQNVNLHCLKQQQESLQGSMFYVECFYHFIILFHPAITCSKLTIETLEQGVKYVQS